MQPIGEEIEVENHKAWADFSGKLRDSEGSGIRKRKMAELVRDLKGRVRKKPRSFATWKPGNSSAKRFQKAFRNFVNRANTSGNYLSFDDPRMAQTRREHAEAIEKNNVPMSLVLMLGCLQLVLIQGVHLTSASGRHRAC